MLYHSRSVILIAIFLLATGCDDLFDVNDSDEEPRVVILEIDAPERLVGYCTLEQISGPITVRVHDQNNVPWQHYPLRVVLNETQTGHLEPENDSLYYANDQGELHLTYVATWPWSFNTVLVIAESDTVSASFHVSYNEGFLGAWVHTRDTLYRSEAGGDSLTVYLGFIYDHGSPHGEKVRLHSSRGSIDTTERTVESLYDSLYWYDDGLPEFGDVKIYAEVIEYCGITPFDTNQRIIYDSTSFILAPAP